VLLKSLESSQQPTPTVYTYGDAPDEGSIGEPAHRSIGGASPDGSRIAATGWWSVEDGPTSDRRPLSLPAIEPVATGGLAPPDGGSDEPEEAKDHRGDPKYVEGKTGPDEDQHDHKNKEQDHTEAIPIYPVCKRDRQRAQNRMGAPARPGPR
jgi:hypothetical protein